MSTLTENEIRLLINSGDVVECPCCGELSAYAWENADAYPEGEPIFHGQKPDAGKVAHVPASDCWSWQCGHCFSYLTERDSPLTAEVYTHLDLDNEDCF